jgi:hypothetical protein
VDPPRTSFVASLTRIKLEVKQDMTPIWVLKKSTDNLHLAAELPSWMLQQNASEFN